MPKSNFIYKIYIRIIKNLFVLVINVQNKTMKKKIHICTYVCIHPLNDKFIFLVYTHSCILYMYMKPEILLL